MKSFLNFLSEAPSQPAKDAARKGWKGDGHGNWIDHTGRIVAKTDHGKLKIYDKKEAEEANSKKIGVKQENPKGSIKSNPETERRIEKEPVKSDTSSKVEPSPIGGSAPPPPPSNADGSPKEGRGNMTIVFGRFNPPTVGHKKLLDTAKKASGGGQLRIYPSRYQDSKKNPLEPEQKVEVMGKMFPDYATHIVNDPNAKTIFDALKQAYDDGFNNVKIVVGDDRLSEFDKLSQNYNGKLYNFGNLETISAGERDPDGEDKTTFTATAGQTTFSLTYTVGYIDVYLNGVRLSESEYTASNGTSVVLDDGAALGDIIDILETAYGIGTQGIQGLQGFSHSRTDTSFTATAGQTTFSLTYTVGYIDVYLNGGRLSADEYTASNGSSVVLDVGASVGDIIDITTYTSAGPQGIQGIQGQTGGSAGITVEDEGSALSTTATTLDFVGSGVVASGTGATKTITISGGGGGITIGKSIAMTMIFG